MTEHARDTLQQAFAAVFEGRASDALELLDTLSDDGLDEEMRAASTAARIAAMNIGNSAGSATQVLQDLCADESQSLWMLSRVGDLLVEMQHPEQALTIFRECARREPEEAGTHYNVGIALRATGELDGAITQFTKAIGVDDSFYPAWAELASTLHGMDRVDEAAEAMGKYLELVPDDVNNWVALGVMESQREDFQAAEDAFDRAAALDDSYPPLWLNRGVTAQHRGEIEQLRACHKKLAEGAPESWQEAMLRAMVHSEDEDIWQGWEAMQEAIERVDEEFLPEGQLDHPTRVHVYALALEYLHDHELHEQFESLRDRALHTRLFDQRILDIVREAHGEHADQAHLYSVVIVAEASEALQEQFSSPELAPPAGYCRMYSVIAADEVQARAAVDDFEQKLGESSSFTVKHVRPTADVGDEYIGVASIAGVYFHAEDDISDMLERFVDNLDLE